MRAVRIAQNIVLGVISALGAASILFVAAVLLFGLRPADVISGSMVPTIPVGSIVLTEEVPASQLHVGEIVQVPRASDHTVVTHRIQSIEKKDSGYLLTLKGDANAKADPQQYLVSSADLYQAHLPYAGYLTGWVKAYPVYSVLILFGLLTFCFVGRSRVSVELADGEVIQGLTKREAERLVHSLSGMHA